MCGGLSHATMARLLDRDARIRRGSAAPPSLFAQAPAAALRRPPPRNFTTLRSRMTRTTTRSSGVRLWVVLGVAVAGLLYASMLVGQVLGADQGTEKMRSVAKAIRMGANAYLSQQFRAIILLVFIITGIMWAVSSGEEHVAIGRAAAFFMGAAFSWTVGYVGMSLAVRETSAWPRRPAPATVRRSSSATAPARSRVC